MWLKVENVRDGSFWSLFYEVTVRRHKVLCNYKVVAALQKV